jgi:hypothetical protein
MPSRELPVRPIRVRRQDDLEPHLWPDYSQIIWNVETRSCPGIGTRDEGPTQANAE